MKRIMTMIIMLSLIVCTLCGCSIGDLKNKGNADKEENKETKYEDWMTDSGISLDGKMISYEATVGNKEIKIEEGSLKRKGYSYFSIKTKDKEITLYKKQGMNYLYYDKMWAKSSVAEESDDIILPIINSLTGSISDKIEILESEYSKTVEKDDKIYDIVNITTVDKEKQKQLEDSYKDSMKVKDDAEYGNEIQVIINDGNKKKDEEDIPTIELKVYIDTETNEIAKIQWPINGSKATFEISTLDDAIPKKAENGLNQSNKDFADIFVGLVENVLY